LNIVFGIPRTIPVFSCTVMGVIAPLLPVQSTVAALAGQADLGLLQALVQQRFGFQYLDQKTPNRFRPQHKDMIVCWSKNIYVKHPAIIGGFGPSNVSSIGVPVESNYFVDECTTIKKVTIRRNFRGKMRFTVYQGPLEWIPGTVNAKYVFMGNDKTTPLIYFICYKMRQIGWKIRPNNTAVAPGAEKIYSAANPYDQNTVNTFAPGAAAGANELGTEPYTQQNCTVVQSTNYFSWYRNEVPGQLGV